MAPKEKYGSGHEKNRNAGSGGAPDQRSDNGLVDVPFVPASSQRVNDAADEFIWLLGRDDGWLRAIPGGNGKVNYFKWKFSSGPWRNHYVMWVGAVGDWAGGILGVAKKVRAVDAGEARPAMDTFYEP